MNTDRSKLTFQMFLLPPFSEKRRMNLGCKISETSTGLWKLHVVTFQKERILTIIAILCSLK